MFIKTTMIMLLLHLFADYTLQGILAQMKQKKWWLKQCSDNGYDFLKYKRDYITSLACHALYWTILTFAPLWMVMSNQRGILAVVLFNTIAHAFIDDLKANKEMITLEHDQLLHLAQIIVTQFIVWPFI